MDKISDVLHDKKYNSQNFRDHYQALMQQVYQDPDVKRFLQQHQVTTDERDYSATKLYEFVTQKKKLEQGQTNLVPGYVPKLIWNDHLIDVGYQPTPQTKAKRRTQAMQKRFHAFLMPKSIRKCTLSNFDISDDTRGTLGSVGMQFIQNYCNDPHHFHPGIYVYGNFGVGKTYFLAAIANGLVEHGVDTTMVHFPSLAVELKNSIGNHSSTDKIDFIKKTPVLFLDDIGADAMSAWIRDDVFGIILEYRMQNELPTFFSSNYSMDEFEHEHLQVDNHGNNDEVKAKRLMQRVRFLSREYRLDGDNKRLQS